QHFGDVNEYLRDRKVGSFRQIEQEVKSNKAEGRSEESLNGKEKEEKKKKENQLNEIQNQITRHERRIEKLETEIKAIDEKLMHPEVYSEIVNNKETFATYEKLKKQLEEEMKKWEELQGELALL
ncbi:MAG: ABC transporter C-terminal domain-containing protein, partial [Bacteroidota bacterium]